MSQQDAPVTTFRALYTLIVVGGVILTVALLVWLLFELFANSNVGTARTAAMAESLPTRTALAQLVPPPEDTGAPPEPQCTACHQPSGQPCPPFDGVAAIAEERIAAADYTGSATTAKEYLLESIQEPNAYIVDGYTEGVMPPCGGLADCSDANVERYVKWFMLNAN